MKTGNLRADRMDPKYMCHPLVAKAHTRYSSIPLRLPLQTVISNICYYVTMLLTHNRYDTVMYLQGIAEEWHHNEPLHSNVCTLNTLCYTYTNIPGTVLTKKLWKSV